MKERFTFFLDPKLKKRMKKYGENHNPRLPIAQVIIKAINKLFIDHDNNN
jgi:hypothetical protein